MTIANSFKRFMVRIIDKNWQMAVTNHIICRRLDRATLKWGTKKNKNKNIC